MPRASAQDQVLPALVEKGHLTAEDRDRVQRLAATDPNGHSAVYFLMQLGLVSSVTLAAELGRHFQVRGVDLDSVTLTPALLEKVPAATATERQVVPLQWTDTRTGPKLLIALADPTDFETQDHLRVTLGAQIDVVVADEHSLEKAVTRHYGGTTHESPPAILAELAGEADDTMAVRVDDDFEAQVMEEEVDKAPVVKLVRHVLADAVARGASDVHFEFYETDARVRYRIDGALVEMMAPARRLEKLLTSRLKVLAKLDIAERRRPQDGRARLKIGERTVDFRVSTLPTNFGEKVVLRILDRTQVSLDVQALGMDQREREILLETIQSPYGMVLATGPTGSGKTTTLYALLNLLNTADTNIITIEDPIEYDLKGINQTSLKTEVNYTFATALKAFLRQDPDVIMVGEMRDAETAEIGARAALTGHLLLSTMHTNDAVGAITRLADLGIERFHISQALSVIIAQRLVRRVCARCAMDATYDDQMLRLARLTREEAATIPFKRGLGCDHCNGTGYRGRVGLYEILRITPEISELILAGKGGAELKARALRDGMQTLRMAGLRRVRDGLTTLDEIVKHTAA